MFILDPPLGTKTVDPFFPFSSGRHVVVAAVRTVAVVATAPSFDDHLGLEPVVEPLDTETVVAEPVNETLGR